MRQLILVFLTFAFALGQVSCNKRDKTNGGSTPSSATASANVDPFKDRAAAIAAAEQQAQLMAIAMPRKDFPTVIKYSHPKLVAAMGGTSKMIDTMTTGLRDMQIEGISIDDVRVGKAGQFTVQGRQAWLILPETLFMRTPKGRMIKEGFLVGVSEDGGTNWVFLDGQGINFPAVKQLFPEIPSSLSFPALPPLRAAR